MSEPEHEQIQEFIDELQSPDNVRFKRLVAICSAVFGEPRIRGSHHIFKTPWQGDPRINLQKVKGGKAKKYQVGQVVAALSRRLLQLEEDAVEE